MNLLFACFLALLPLGVGLYLFFLLGSWQQNYTVKMCQVKTGEVNPELLTIAEKSTSHGVKHSTCCVTLRAGSQLTFVTSVPEVCFNAVQVGDQVVAYRFADGYFIPQFYTGGWWIGQALFVLFGLAVAGMVIAKPLLRWRKANAF